MLHGATSTNFAAQPEIRGRIGRYEVLLRLGTGGMAAVYLARAVAEGGFERLVALKVLHPHLVAEEEFLSMFLDEARVAARIHHPNVVAIQDLGVEGDRMYTVMDYVQGDTLAAAQQTAIALRRGLPVPVVLRVALDALAGLDAAHDLVDADGRSLHVVHRDVSPHNVLLGTDGVSRVTDFGIAKAESRIAHTEVGTLKGKSAYMAPEQFAGRRVDRRADLYAMAITIWEAIALRRCLPPDLANGGRRPAYRPLASILADVPAELDAILVRALSNDPAMRWRSASEFAEAIERNLRDHIATHRAVSVFVRAFAREKVERERVAIREAERVGAHLRGRSGIQLPSGRPGASAASAQWGPSIATSLRDEEVEAPTKVRPPRTTPAVRAVAPAPELRKPRGASPLTVLRGGTLLGTGLSPSSCPPIEEIEADEAFVSIPPPSVAPPPVDDSAVRPATVLDPDGRPASVTAVERAAAPRESAEARELPAWVSAPRQPSELSLINPDIPRPPKVPGGVKLAATPPEVPPEALSEAPSDAPAEPVPDAPVELRAKSSPPAPSVRPAAPEASAPQASVSFEGTASDDEAVRSTKPSPSRAAMVGGLVAFAAAIAVALSRL